MASAPIGFGGSRIPMPVPVPVPVPLCRRLARVRNADVLKHHRFSQRG